MLISFVILRLLAGKFSGTWDWTTLNGTAETVILLMHCLIQLIEGRKERVQERESVCVQCLMRMCVCARVCACLCEPACVCIVLFACNWFGLCNPCVARACWHAYNYSLCMPTSMIWVSMPTMSTTDATSFHVFSCVKMQILYTSDCCGLVMYVIMFYHFLCDHLTPSGSLLFLGSEV